MKRIFFVMMLWGLSVPFSFAQNSDLNVAEQILNQCLSQHQLPVLVFGPKQYVRETGTPQTVTETFSIPSNSIAPYKIIVVNPFSIGSTVTSATIKINGITIFSPSDFKRFYPLLTKIVSLQSINTF